MGVGQAVAQVAAQGQYDHLGTVDLTSCYSHEEASVLYWTLLQGEY